MIVPDGVGRGGGSNNRYDPDRLARMEAEADLR